VSAELRLLVVGSALWRDQLRVTAEIKRLYEGGWGVATLLHSGGKLESDAARVWTLAGGRTRRVSAALQVLDEDPPDLAVVFLEDGYHPARAFLDKAAKPDTWCPVSLCLAHGEPNPYGEVPGPRTSPETRTLGDFKWKIGASQRRYGARR
jgi:hypothetical protein